MSTRRRREWGPAGVFPQALPAGVYPQAFPRLHVPLGIAGLFDLTPAVPVIQKMSFVDLQDEAPDAVTVEPDIPAWERFDLDLDQEEFHVAAAAVSSVDARVGR